MPDFEFAGWVPCITGRLSFSRIGTPSNNHSAVCCNKTDSHRFLFAFDVRKSRDGPVPSVLLPLLRRSPEIFALGNFQVERGKLPLEYVGAVPKLGDDEQANLVGEAILFTRSQDRTIDNRVAEIKRHIRRIQDPYRAADLVAADVVASRQIYEHLWEQMRRWFDADVRAAPAFARVSMFMSRTGETRIGINRRDIYFTEDARERHWLEARNRVEQTDPEPQWDAAAHFIAHQSFFFLRDLAHRHYHHKAHSDMGTVVFPWSIDSDEEWRRETHYGLVRLAIKSRREDDPVTYKQSLGVIAYAESFQRHLAGWVNAPAQGPVQRTSFYPYDFSALKQSIEASLRVLDFRSAQQVQHFAYITVTALTTVGLILAAGEVMSVANRVESETAPLPTLAVAFWKFIAWLIEYPVEVIVVVALATTLLLFRSQVVRQVGVATRLIGGFTRAAHALLGTWVAHSMNAVTAYALAALSGLVVFAIGVGWIGLVLFALFWVLENGVELARIADWLARLRP